MICMQCIRVWIWPILRFFPFSCPIHERFPHPTLNDSPPGKDKLPANDAYWERRDSRRQARRKELSRYPGAIFFFFFFVVKGLRKNTADFVRLYVNALILIVFKSWKVWNSQWVSESLLRNRKLIRYCCLKTPVSIHFPTLIAQPQWSVHHLWATNWCITSTKVVATFCSYIYANMFEKGTIKTTFTWKAFA